MTSRLPPNMTTSSITTAAPQNLRNVVPPHSAPAARVTQSITQSDKPAIIQRSLNTAFSGTSRRENSNGSPKTSTPPDEAAIQNTSSNGTEQDKKKKRLEQDKKRKEAQRNLGLSFCEDDIVLENGMMKAIKDIPLASISLEALKTFARKSRLRVKTNVSKVDLVNELVNYKLLGPQRELVKQTAVAASCGDYNLPNYLNHIDGTIFRVILTILDVDNREAYLGTGHQITQAELGANERHLPNVCQLEKTYVDYG